MANDHDIQFATAHAEREAVLAAPPPEGGERRTTFSRSQAVERDGALLALLRQLSSGFSAYRLFPGDLKQPSFQQAVRRIQETAQKALAWGPIEAEVLGSRFDIGDGPTAADERVERLALALYQHRAERFWMRSVPDGRELGVLYEALGRPVEDGSLSGGVGSALRVGGVKSMTVSEIAMRGSGEDVPTARTTDEQHALWAKLSRPDGVARELVAEAAKLATAHEAAEAVLARVQRLVSVLPERLVKGFELYGRLHEVLFRLPKELRRAVIAILLDRVRQDPLAERIIGTLSDADLARVLVDQGAGDPTRPLGLARWLVAAGTRREDLIELTAALQAGSVEQGTIFAGLDRIGIAAPEIPGASPMAQTVSSLLARGLVGIGQEDVAAIGEAFPDAPGERRRVALEALADYLLIDSDTDRLGEVLGVWADDAAAALRLRDEDNLALLIRALSGILGDGVPAAKRSLAEATMRRVLSSDMLAELITLADEEGRAEAAAHLLRPFGDVAVDALMDELAQEQDRGRRAVLLGVLAEAARGHHHRVAGRLSDSRWFVARNAVTVLYRSGDPEVIPVLIETFHHREPAVRREAVRGVLAVAGLDALPQLLTLSADPDASVRSAVISSVGGMTTPDACQALARLAHAMKEPADRRQIIEALARHPSTDGAEALAGLASAKARPRLPRRIRRHAKARLRNRRAVASS